MLYNDIVIDGMIKRAAYQAAQETVYMMKRAAESPFDDENMPPVNIETNNPKTRLAGMLMKAQDAGKGAIDWLKSIAAKAEADRKAYANSTEGMIDNDMNELANSLTDYALTYGADQASKALADTPIPEPSGDAMDRFNQEQKEELEPKMKPYTPQAANVFEGATDEDKQEIIKIHDAYKRKAMLKSILEHLGDNKYTYGGGVAGAGLGALLGKTPKERLLYALLGGGGGAGLGALADRYL